jgi:hypothetical protein
MNCCRGRFRGILGQQRGVGGGATLEATGHLAKSHQC